MKQNFKCWKEEERKEVSFRQKKVERNINGGFNIVVAVKNQHS